MLPTLSHQQKALVQSTFTHVAGNSSTFSMLFYQHLFEIAPQVRLLFKTGIDVQGPKLIAMMLVAVKGLDKLDQLMPGLQQLAERHISYGVKREHYEPVGQALLWALEKTLGAAFTPDAKEAWAAAYDLISMVCIEAAYS